MSFKIDLKSIKILNKEGLRNNKEFVNHKILDLAGDFLLSGHRVIGKIVCHQGGHELTNIFLRKLFNSKTSFKIVEIENFVNSDESVIDMIRVVITDPSYIQVACEYANKLKSLGYTSGLNPIRIDSYSEKELKNFFRSILTISMKQNYIRKVIINGILVSHFLVASVTKINFISQ